MKPSAELQRDHDVLQAKLAKLHGWLPHVHAAPMTVQNLLASIARRLHMHMHKEELLLVAALTKLPTQPKRVTHQLFVEHESHRQAMTLLLERLAAVQDGPVNQVAKRASSFIDGLAAYMTSEQDRLLPVLDRILNGQFEDEPSRFSRESPGGLEGREGPGSFRVVGGGQTKPQSSLEAVCGHTVGAAGGEDE